MRNLGCFLSTLALVALESCAPPGDTHAGSSPATAPAGSASLYSALDDDGWVLVASANADRGAAVLEVAPGDTATSLRVRVQGSELSPRYQLYIDADGDEATGIAVAPWQASGIDYLVESGVLYPASVETQWFDPSAGLTVEQFVDETTLELSIEGLEGLTSGFALGFVELAPTEGDYSELSKLPVDVLVRQTAVDTAPSPEPATARDWLELANSGSGPDQARLAVARRDNDAEPLVIGLFDPRFSQAYQIYIDVDLDPSTGIQPGVWEEVGAEYLIENGTLYRTDEATGWVAASPGTPVVSNVIQGGVELVIPASDLPGLHPGLDVGLGFLKRSSTPNSAPVLKLPLTTFYRPKPTWAGGGLIIPAYINLNLDLEWKALATQAAALLATASSARDFWVVLNGANGPYPDADVETARARVADIKTAGGKLFGYVHACDSIKNSDGTFTCKGLYSTDTVNAQIYKWLEAFPELDGIWIDEFYPQFELNSSKVGSQFLPDGGTFETITAYIRQEAARRIRTLSIVGNAGGRLVSDRLKYAGLVDVLCSFEAAGSYLKPGTTSTGLPWPGITRQPVKPRYGQLALIHSVADQAGMQDAVTRSFNEGFSHVFVGQGMLSDDTAWRHNPTYLAAEITAVAQALQ